MFSRTTTMSTSVGAFAADRAFDTGEKVDRTEVDVLVEIEPQAQQDPLLQHARRAPCGSPTAPSRMASRLAELPDRRVGQDLAGPQVVLAADVDVRELDRRSPPRPPTAARTCRLSAITSGPTPSPATTPILIKAPSATSPFRIEGARPPCHFLSSLSGTSLYTDDSRQYIHSRRVRSCQVFDRPRGLRGLAGVAAIGHG